MQYYTLRVGQQIRITPIDGGAKSEIVINWANGDADNPRLARFGVECAAADYATPSVKADPEPAKPATFAEMPLVLYPEYSVTLKPLAERGTVTIRAIFNHRASNGSQTVSVEYPPDTFEIVSGLNAPRAGHGPFRNVLAGRRPKIQPAQ